MSALNEIRPIPSRPFPVSYIGTQQPYSNPSDAWVPRYRFQGSAMYVRFNPGTVNGFLPSNWTEEFYIPSSSQRYVKLEVTTTKDKGISSVNILVESNYSVTNVYNKDFPVLKFKFIIGCVKGTEYYMTTNKPITVDAVEAYRLPKTKFTPGENPFDIYWHWLVQ